MGNIYSKSTSGSSPAAPGPFNRLPAELRWQMWKYAAEEWVALYLDDLCHWTVAGKHIYLISFDSDIRHLGRDASGKIDFKKGYILELPPLLFVCHESRNIMYDALLTFPYCTEKKRGIRAPDVPGGDVQVYLRDCICQKNNWWCPQVFGWKIIDFRYPGLAEKVKEERKRIEHFGKELQQVANKKAVDEKAAPEGYVRLPPFHFIGTYIEERYDDGRRSRRIELYPRWETEYRFNGRAREDGESHLKCW